MMDPGGPADSPDSALESPADVPFDLSVTQVSSDGRETRLRALFTLFFHEAGLEPAESTIVALAATAHRMGYALVPVRR